MATKITSEKALVAGILYCLFETEEDPCTGEMYDKSGMIVYWTGTAFMDEDGDECYEHWDYAVAQSTTPNRDYIAL